jgi:hypothetical protein
MVFPFLWKFGLCPRIRPLLNSTGDVQLFIVLYMVPQVSSSTVTLTLSSAWLCLTDEALVVISVTWTSVTCDVYLPDPLN